MDAKVVGLCVSEWSRRKASLLQRAPQHRTTATASKIGGKMNKSGANNDIKQLKIKTNVVKRCVHRSAPHDFFAARLLSLRRREAPVAAKICVAHHASPSSDLARAVA